MAIDATKLWANAFVSDLQATHPGVKFDLHIDGPTIGEFDRDRIQQAVANLLSNAIKFGTGWVAVHTRSSEDFVSVEVSNGGAAISQERAALLFDKFERGGEARPGTGLGLYIVQLIARAHGGDLSLHSDDTATTFTMRLPK